LLAVGAQPAESAFLRQILGLEVGGGFLALFLEGLEFLLKLFDLVVGSGLPGDKGLDFRRINRLVEVERAELGEPAAELAGQRADSAVEGSPGLLDAPSRCGLEVWSAAASAWSGVAGSSRRRGS